MSLGSLMSLDKYMYLFCMHQIKLLISKECTSVSSMAPKKAEESARKRVTGKSTAPDEADQAEPFPLPSFRR
jgi:hypothetical protein